jgi:tRNA(Ile2) C34 agmatinyltransferase TiaS
MGWLLVVFFVIFIIALLKEKANDKAEEKSYNNGICPKCGRRMGTINDSWGNDIGFGCANCGYKAPNKYIGSDYDHLRKKQK